MKRETLKKIIKLRSCWRIDRRIGNYRLPSGDKLSDYVTKLVWEQLETDHLTICSDGFLRYSAYDKDNMTFTALGAFGRPDETIEYDTLEKRINNLVYEMIN